MTIGLVLGKFAPLHRGHQLLIERARQENDEVVVMVYNAPDVTTVPLPVRAGWMRALYPAVQVIEAWDGPLEVGDTAEIKRMHERYILKKLGSRRITNFYSSEFYGEHVSRALGANDRRIDPERQLFPVSGTAVRQNPYTCRANIHPVVYRDLITKAVFLGAPSTGKTTLACELAREHHTAWMPEYGREYWETHHCNRRLTLDQLVEIAEEHRVREDALVLEANQTLFIDTDATTTLMFSRYYHGTARERLVELAEQTRDRYDLFFLCGADIPYDDSGDRSGDAQRQLFQEQIRADLLSRKIPFVTLEGSLRERKQRVNKVLCNYDRYTSVSDQLINAGTVGQPGDPCQRSEL